MLGRTSGGASARTSGRSRLLVAIALVSSAAVAPTALGDLAGSGNITDILSLSTTTATIAGAALTTSDGSPAVSASAFTMTNGNSNVDSFIRYAWGTTPYYGATTSDTSITLHGTTHYISALLMYKQETITGGGTTTTSEYFSPLVLNNAASNPRATFTAAGNACTAWTGTAALGFSAAAAGTLTFKYYAASSQTDNTPSTSDTFYYCLDTTNSKVYLGTSTAFGSATLVTKYTDNSALGVLDTYQYQFLSSGQSAGNHYCLSAYTGSGTAATPDLLQCQKFAYSTSGSATTKIYPLFDPPTYFPSANQAGSSNAITFAIAGTQWNPYSYTTTNTAG